MTKQVELGTIEHGLREAFGYLGLDGAVHAIEAATGNRKSASLLRKYADPDSPRHHIPLRDAMAVDQACVGAGHKPPLLTTYETVLEEAPEGNASTGDDPSICILALATGAAAGMVAEAVLQSETCHGCRCNKNQHREEIYASLVELEDAVGALRRAITVMDEAGLLTSGPPHTPTAGG